MKVILFKSNLDWCYRSIVHEFPLCLSKKSPQRIKLDGARNLDKNKYLNDANLMISRYEIDKITISSTYVDVMPDSRYVTYELRLIVTLSTNVD